MSGGRWTRFPRGVACPACGHMGHCTIAPDRTAVKCTRNTDGIPQKVDSRGVPSWLHKIDPDSSVGAVVKTLAGKAEVPRMTRSDVETLAKRFRTALSPKRLESLVAKLGVTEAALRAYGVGWDDRCGAYTFPMFTFTKLAGAKGRDVCGFRYRSLDGHNKACVLGSRQGLFIPDTYDAAEARREHPGDASTLLDQGSGPGPVLLLPEGPTDAATAWDGGYRNAVGRPNNCGGAKDVRTLLAGSRPDVVVFADYDPTKYLPNGMPYWPGHEGALQVIASILPACKGQQLDVVFAEDMTGSDAMRKASSEANGRDCKVDLRSWVGVHGVKALPAALAGAATCIGAPELQALVSGMDKYRAAVWDAWKHDHGLLPRVAGVIARPRRRVA